ncbi:MAG: hypothetical protein SVV80_14530, partial [Planctomycetota bacterium]|nr:hypothetical protein [Planctomycetota bacterium]
IGRRADITAQPWQWLGWVWRYNLFVISDAAANLHKISYAIRVFISVSYGLGIGAHTTYLKPVSQRADSGSHLKASSCSGRT